MNSRVFQARAKKGHLKFDCPSVGYLITTIQRGYFSEAADQMPKEVVSKG